jgi:hypothetical protein
MPEQLNSEDERNVRRIARSALWDSLTVERVETIISGPNEGEVMLEVTAEHDLDGRNAFAGDTLNEFIEEGYIPTSVGAGAHGGSVWFRPIGVGLDL